MRNEKQGSSLSRRRFLELGGTGLAGAAVLGAAGCSSGEQAAAGPTELIFSYGPDPSGALQQLIDGFNQRHKGKISIRWRKMPPDSSVQFNQLRTEFQAGGGDIDVIGADVIWPAPFAANGYILDLSDRFPPAQREKFREADIQANLYDGKIWGVPWFTGDGMLYYRLSTLTV